MVWPLVKVSATAKVLNVRSPHPVAGEPGCIWVSDAPHIIKNFWVQLSKGDLQLPVSVVQQEELPSALVSMSHVKELLQQQAKGAKLAPKLSESHVAPKAFEKMRVGFATYLFSEVVGNALLFWLTKGSSARKQKQQGGSSFRWPSGGS